MIEMVVGCCKAAINSKTGVEASDSKIRRESPIADNIPKIQL